MGMERLTSVLQGVASNYRTDLFAPIIARTAELAGIDRDDPALQVDLNVVGDHVRALTFLIADGIMPANDGRGYVLRRLLRRAVKHGKSLNLQGSFLHQLSGSVVEVMKPFYPELEPNREFIAKIDRHGRGALQPHPGQRPEDLRRPAAGGFGKQAGTAGRLRPVSSFRHLRLPTGLRPRPGNGKGRRHRFRRFSARTT